MKYPFAYRFESDQNVKWPANYVLVWLFYLLETAQMDRILLSLLSNSFLIVMVLVMIDEEEVGMAIALKAQEVEMAMRIQTRSKKQIYLYTNKTSSQLFGLKQLNQ